MQNYILIILVLLTIGSCKKEEKTGEVLFYVGAETLPYSYDLIIDNINRGELTAAGQMPVCNDPGFIKLTLDVGTHTIDVKSNDGLAWGNPKNFEVVNGCNQYKAKP